MDELEFRRRLFAQPADKDEELLEFAKQSPVRMALLKELRDFDKQLHHAMDVDVPDNLADKIILQQTMSEQPDKIKALSSKRKKKSWYLALVASVAIMFSVLTYQLVAPPLTIGEHALAHVYHEIESLESTQQFTIADVNSQLAKLGSKMTALPGEVKYARFCNFKGQRGMHLVFASAYGPMTVFIVPSENDYLGSDYFTDEHFAGRVSRFPKGDAILVASTQAPLDEYQDRINESIQWL